MVLHVPQHRLISRLFLIASSLTIYHSVPLFVFRNCVLLTFYVVTFPMNNSLWPGRHHHNGISNSSCSSSCSSRLLASCEGSCMRPRRVGVAAMSLSCREALRVALVDR